MCLASGGQPVRNNRRFASVPGRFFLSHFTQSAAVDPVRLITHPSNRVRKVISVPVPCDQAMQSLGCLSVQVITIIERRRQEGEEFDSIYLLLLLLLGRRIGICCRSSFSPPTGRNL